MQAFHDVVANAFNWLEFAANPALVKRMNCLVQVDGSSVVDDNDLLVITSDSDGDAGSFRSPIRSTSNVSARDEIPDVWDGFDENCAAGYDLVTSPLQVSDCSDSASVIYIGTLPLLFSDPSLYVDGVLFLSQWMSSIIDSMSFVAHSCLRKLAAFNSSAHTTIGYVVGGYVSQYYLDTKFLA